MFKTLTSLSVIALTALAAPAMAQDTETEQPAADQLLDLGKPADAEPQLGSRYSKEEVGDWDLACIKTEGETDPCSLLQILNDDKGNPMAEFSLFRIEGKGQAVAGPRSSCRLNPASGAADPLGRCAPGKRYGYSFCNPYGCVAQIGLTEEDIAASSVAARRCCHWCRPGARSAGVAEIVPEGIHRGL